MRKMIDRTAALKEDRNFQDIMNHYSELNKKQESENLMSHGEKSSEEVGAESKAQPESEGPLDAESLRSHATLGGLRKMESSMRTRSPGKDPNRKVTSQELMRIRDVHYLLVKGQVMMDEVKTAQVISKIDSLEFIKTWCELDFDHDDRQHVSECFNFVRRRYDLRD